MCCRPKVKVALRISTSVATHRCPWAGNCWSAWRSSTKMTFCLSRDLCVGVCHRRLTLGYRQLPIHARIIHPHLHPDIQCSKRDILLFLTLDPLRVWFTFCTHTSYRKMRVIKAYTGQRILPAQEGAAYGGKRRVVEHLALLPQAFFTSL